MAFTCGSDSKESACNSGDLGLIPSLGRSPAERNGYPLQYSCLEKSMNRGAWPGYSPWCCKESDMTKQFNTCTFFISSVQSFNRVQLFGTPWTAGQTSLSITKSQSLLKLMSIDSVMPSNHLIHCHPLLLLPSIFPSIRVFSNESVPQIRWPKYWSFSFSISPSNDYSGLISSRTDWLDLLAVQGTLKSPPKPQIKSISSVLSFLYSSTLTTMHDY